MYLGVQRSSVVWAPLAFPTLISFSLQFGRDPAHPPVATVSFAPFQCLSPWRSLPRCHGWMNSVRWRIIHAPFPAGGFGFGESSWGWKAGSKVETPIHEKNKGIGNLGVQRAWSEIMNVLANPKGSVGRWNLNFWRLQQYYTNF
jgi:hypothetical protein